MSLTVIQGVDVTFTLQIKSNQVPYLGYTTGNTLRARMSLGPEYPALSPGPTTDNAAIATSYFDLTIPGAATTPNQPGEYFLEVDALVGSDYRPAYYGAVNVLPSVGTGVALPVYNTLQDMQDFYPTILSFFDTKVHVFGYMRQCNRVWADINHFLIERYDPQPGFNRRRNGTYDSIVGFDTQDLVTDPPTPAAIRTALAAGGLFLSSPDDKFISGIAAVLSVAEVLCPQDSADRRSNPFAQIAADMRVAAIERLMPYRAYIDLDLDGSPDVIITRDVIFLD